MDNISKRTHKSNQAASDMTTYAETYEKELKSDPLVRIIIVGAGNRGKVYSGYALEHPSRAKVYNIFI